MIAQNAFAPAIRIKRKTRHAASRPAASRLALESAVLALSLIAAVLGSTHWVNPAWSIIAFANYIWLCTLMFRIEPRGTILVLPLLINKASSLVSLIMIEFGSEMFELGITGEAGPWSNTFNLYSLLFCIGVISVTKPIIAAIEKRDKSALTAIFDRYSKTLAILTLFIAFIIIAALIIRGLQAGFPLLAGTDRFAFRRFSADKVTLYALNLKYVIGLSLGFVVFSLPCTRTVRTVGVLTYAIMIVVFFLFGDKFFTQLHAFSAFFAPYLYKNHGILGRNIWKYSATAILALAGVMTVTTYIYSNGFTETQAATAKRLSGRLVGQGQLWFLQSRIGSPIINLDSNLNDRYAQSLFIKSPELFAIQKSLGAHYFSNRYAPDYLKASIHRNAGSVTYTELTEAMGLALFGWVGLGIFMASIGIITGLAAAYLAYAIHNRSILSCIFSAYIFTQLRSSITQATPWVIGSIYSLKWLSIIFAIEILFLVLARSSFPRTDRHRTPRLSRENP